MADPLDAYDGPKGLLPQWDDPLPTFETDADRLVDLMTTALMCDDASEGFTICPACAGPSGGPFKAVVIIELGGLKWFTSADTARQLAGRLRHSRIAFDDPDAVAAALHAYARQAERLAAGELPSTSPGALVS